MKWTLSLGGLLQKRMGKVNKKKLYCSKTIGSVWIFKNLACQYKATKMWTKYIRFGFRPLCVAKNKIHVVT